MMQCSGFCGCSQSWEFGHGDLESWCCDYLEWGELIKKKQTNKKEATVWIKAGKKRIKGLKGKEVLGMQMEGIFPLSATLPVGKGEKKKRF